MLGFTANFTSRNSNPMALPDNGVINVKQYMTQLRRDTSNQSRCSKRPRLTMKTEGAHLLCNTQSIKPCVHLVLLVVGRIRYMTGGCALWRHSDVD